MRQGRRLCLLAASGLALQLGSCASGPPSADARQARDDAALPGRDACFWTRSVDDWTVLDNSTLIVNAPGPGNHFLVKLFAPVPDLAFQTRLGFESRGGDLDRFCRDNGYVVSRDSINFREPVVAVHALTELDARQLRRASPAAPPDRGAAGSTNPPAR